MVGYPKWKKDAIKAAKELHYDVLVIEKIKHAANEAHAIRILYDARNRN